MTTKKPAAKKAAPPPKKAAPAVAQGEPEGDPPHMLIDFTLSLMTRVKGGPYQLLKPAADKLRHALMDLKGRPDFNVAVKDIAMLAHMLETKHKSPAAAQALLETTESAVLLSQGKALPKHLRRDS